MDCSSWIDCMAWIEGWELMLIGTPVIRFSPHLYCNSRIAWIAWISWSGTHMFTDYPSNWIVNCGLPGLHGFHGMELVCLHLSNWIATCGLPLLLEWHGLYGWEILLEYHLFIWIATIFSSTRVWLFFWHRKQELLDKHWSIGWKCSCSCLDADRMSLSANLGEGLIKQWHSKLCADNTLQTSLWLKV